MEAHFYATFRPLVGGKTVHLDLPSEASVRDLLEAAACRYPALSPLFWTAEGALSDYVKVFVDGREIRHLQMLDTAIGPDSVVDIFPPVAGGSGE